jgi:hypothetical protein
MPQIGQQSTISLAFPPPMPQHLSDTLHCHASFPHNLRWQPFSIRQTLLKFVFSSHCAPLRSVEWIYAQQLTVEIAPDSTLQFRCSLPKDLRQVLQVVASSVAKFAHEVLCSTLQVSILLAAFFFFWPAKVCVRGDRSCTFETL